MKTLSIVLACASLFLAGPAAANGTSMPDCSGVTAANERAVCESTALTRLDAEAATLFEVRMLLPMLMGERGAAQDENEDFTQKLTACGADASCLTSAYQARIAALTDTLKAAMTEFCKLKGIC